MRFSSWLRNETSNDVTRKGTRRRAAPPRFRPRLEALEDRVVPSTLTVTSAADSGAGSLRAEIAAANSGDTINFSSSLSGQTIKLNGELVVNKSLDIEGPGATSLAVSGSNVSRVFDIQGGATVTLAGLTIENGYVHDDSGGGIENESGATLFLNKVTLADNTAYGVGGGLWNQIGATAHVNNATFTGNNAFGSLTFSYPTEA